MQAKINKAVAFLWLILAVGVLRFVLIQVFGKWGDEKVIANYEQGAYTLNNLIFFLSWDIIILIAFCIAEMFTKSIIAKALVGLAIGKILDEAVSPFGLWWGELAWDVAVLIWCVVKWRNKE